MVMRTLANRNGTGSELAPWSVTFPSFTRLFSDMLNDPLFAEVGVGAQSALLPLDIAEDDDNLIVRASLPGFTREEIDVQVHDGILSISAQHKEEHNEQNERYHRRERRFGTFSRQVTLPVNIVAENTEAELKDGVLTLRLPKSQEAKPRKIQIK